LLCNIPEERRSRLLRGGSPKSRAHRYVATSLLLKPLEQRLFDVTSFRLSKYLYSRSVLFISTNNFGSVFPDRLDRRIYETKFSTQVSFFCSVHISLITLTFFLMLKTVL